MLQPSELERVSELQAALAAGELSELEARQLADMLKANPELARAGERLGQLDLLCAAIASEEEQPMPGRGMARALAKLRGPSRWSWIALGLGLAATAAGAAILPGLLGRPAAEAVSPPAAPAPPVEAVPATEAASETQLLPGTRAHGEGPLVLEAGTVVARGDGVELQAGETRLRVSGVGILTTEALEPAQLAARVTQALHLAKGDHMRTELELLKTSGKLSRIAGATLALWVVEGHAQVAQAGAPPLELVAGESWAAPAPKAAPEVAAKDEGCDDCYNKGIPDLHATLQALRPAFAACTKGCTGESCAGRFTARGDLVTAGGIGRLSNPRVDEVYSVQNPFLVLCIEAAMAKADWPSPTDGQRKQLTLPFVVNPSSTGVGYDVMPVDFESRHEILGEPGVPRTVEVGGSPTRGPADAPVTIVEFGDFECPFCNAAQATLHELDAAYPGQLRFVFKQSPMPMHPHALLAAIAALAADRQGQFWPYAEQLFENSNALDRASLVRQAGALGLDAERFAADLDDPSLKAAVDADIAEAKRVKAHGVPAFFINGTPLTGAQPLATFEKAVDAALRAEGR